MSDFDTDIFPVANFKPFTGCGLSRTNRFSSGRIHFVRMYPPANLRDSFMWPFSRDARHFDTPVDQELADRLITHVDVLSDVIGVRHLDKPGTMEGASAYIEQQFSRMGFSVEKECYEIGSHSTHNLIAQIPGVRRASEIIILGAHYDTVWDSPGADDNASAVAVLIEVARLLKDHQSARTIRFVAFTCEEAPYFNLGQMGSQHHARQSRSRGDNIAGMLCLEMMGYYRDEPGSQTLPPGIPRWATWAFPSTANFLGAIGNPMSWKLCWQFRRGFKRATRFPLFSVCLPEKIQEIRRSDNSSFWDCGYPALMLTDTSFLRSPHYHQPSDTPDTLNYSRMSHVTAGVAEAVRRLAR